MGHVYFYKMKKLMSVFFCLLCFQQVTFGAPLIWRSQTIQRPDGALIYRIKESGSFEAPTWLEGEEAIVFTLSLGGYKNDYSNLYLLDTKTSKTVQLTDERNMRITAGDVSMSSKDQLLYVTETENSSQIKGLRVEQDVYGWKALELEIYEEFEETDYWHPSLSTNGKWLAFDAPSEEIRKDGTVVNQIYRKDLKSGEVIALTSGFEEKRRPRWSPDGYLMVYEQYDSQFREWSLYITDLNGVHHRRLTPGMGNECYGSFSPDGYWLVYTSNANLEGEELSEDKLFICSVYGDTSYQLTKSDFFDTMPVWSPNGHRIVFQTSPKDPIIYDKSRIAVIDIPEEIELKK